MHPVTLRVTLAQDSSQVATAGTQSVPGGIPTRSVGTINSNNKIYSIASKLAPT
jgi:hypothetical protein